jgi:hypothetical protein
MFERLSGPDASSPGAASLTGSHTETKQAQGSWVAYPGAAGWTGGCDVCIAAFLQATRLCKRQTLVHNGCKICTRHDCCLSELGTKHA